MLVLSNKTNCFKCLKKAAIRRAMEAFTVSESPDNY